MYYYRRSVIFRRSFDDIKCVVASELRLCNNFRFVGQRPMGADVSSKPDVARHTTITKDKYNHLQVQEKDR